MPGTPLVLDGRAPARAIEARLAERVRALAARRPQAPPALAVVLAGSDPAYLRFGRLKEDACRRIGAEARIVLLPPATPTARLLAEIDRLNDDPRVDGIFLQHPLAPPLDERRSFDRIAPAKDVGGDGSLSFGRAALGEPAFGAVTPAAIMRLLSWYGVPLTGKEAVVVGRSPMIGKPVALMLLAADATVTVCHSRTRGLADIVRRADLVVAAAGRPGLVEGCWIRDGAVVIDAGGNPGGGDVELSEAAHRCAAYTPVRGGVGPMTVATLLEHTVTAAERAVAR